MANPQLENGHIKISNELWEALNRIVLSDGERRVLGVVIRQTYGWNKKKDEISLTQFSKMTGLSRRCVCKVIKSLVVNKRLLGSEQSFTSEQPFTSYIKTYWLIKDYEKWAGGSEQSFTSEQPFTRGSERSGKKVVNARTPTKDNTKDNIQKKEDLLSKSANNRFVKPTFQEVKEYCEQRNNGIDPQHWYAYYESNGWKVGKNPMKSWKGAIITWEKRNG